MVRLRIVLLCACGVECFVCGCEVAYCWCVIAESGRHTRYIRYRYNIQDVYTISLQQIYLYSLNVNMTCAPQTIYPLRVNSIHIYTPPADTSLLNTPARISGTSATNPASSETLFDQAFGHCSPGSYGQLAIPHHRPWRKRRMDNGRNRDSKLSMHRYTGQPTNPTCEKCMG